MIYVNSVLKIFKKKFKFISILIGENLKFSPDNINISFVFYLALRLLL